MTDFETGAVETGTPEVTEPDEGAVEEVETEEPETEEQEVTEPELPEGKKSADSAFAEMRRKNEALEAEIAEMRERTSQYEAQQRDFELAALAEELGIDPDELQEAVSEQERIEALEAENIRYRQEKEQQEAEHEIEKMMREDLAEIQAIDPSIKSFEDLPPEFMDYVGGGVRGAKAYFACLAEKEMTSPKPAKMPGQINKAPRDADYYTEAEIDQMSVEEIQRNLDKVRRSIERF